MRRGAGLDGGKGAPQRLAISGCPSPAQLRDLLAHWQGGVDLLATGRAGGFSPIRRRAMKDLRQKLLADGTAIGRIRVVGSQARLQRADVLADINGYGRIWKADGLPDLLAKALADGGCALIEAGASALAISALQAKGVVEVLPQDGAEGAGAWAGCGMIALRYRASPVPKAPAVAPVVAPLRPDWPEIAQDLAGADGFYRANDAHSFLFIRRSDVLVVTFDNLDLALEKRRDQRPWGFDFIARQGWSMLAVMASGWTWYRDDWVIAQFDQLARDGFFAGFRRVVFYGASMGGYGACAFAGAVPGADVVVISPQSSLDPALVPWERRYRQAAARDFSGRYGDGAQGIKTARRAFVFYDPYQRADARHAARLQGAQVTALRAPLLGHRLGSSLGQMGILSTLILGALEGRLSEGEFYRALRCRHAFPRYQRELFQRALARGRPDLARRVGLWVLARGRHRFIRQAMEKLDATWGNPSSLNALARR